MILFIILAVVYFIPTIIAVFSDLPSNRKWGVFFTNFLLGWTVIGFIVAIFLIIGGSDKLESQRREDVRHQEQMAMMQALIGIKKPTEERHEFRSAEEAMRNYCTAKGYDYDEWIKNK